MPIHSSLSLVIDSNIWIYLTNCGLLEAVFRLGSLHVPDLMFTTELLTEVAWHDVQTMGTIFDELNSESMTILAKILSTTGGVSVPDVACLVLAEQLKISLATHDKKLLTVARKRNVRTYNYDALLELMVQESIIDRVTQQAASEIFVRPSR